MLRKPKCEIYDITTIRTSGESHVPWKNLFHKKPFYFNGIANFEADNEIEDNKAVGNKTAIIYKQNSMMNGYNLVSGLDDVLQRSYYESP